MADHFTCSDNHYNKNMIIYGTNGRHLKSQKSTFSTCPNCGERGHINIHLYGQYAHVFWIPFFPISRRVLAVCENCDHEMGLKTMPEDVKRDYNNIKAVHKTPIWFFSGLFIILAVVLGVIVSEEASARNTEKYIQSLQVGDHVEFITEGSNYSSFRVEAVLEDSLVVTFNDYEVYSKGDIDEILVDSCYKWEMWMYPMDEIQRLYDVDTIYKVKR